MRSHRTHLVLLALLLCGCATGLYAQSSEINLHKYWTHRHRMIGDGTHENPGFVKIVDDPASVPGSMIPVAWLAPYAHCGLNFFFGQNRERCLIGDQGIGGVHGGADGTAHLGWYIGFLAMEYGMLNLTEQTEAKDATALELWKALEAYERLDSTAETKYGFPGALDGFFLRNDMPADYHSQLDRYGNPNFPDYSCTESPLLCNQHRENTEAYSNVPSGDQINFLMLGAALVKANLAPGEVIVRGEDVRYKAQRMVHLIISHLRNDNWYIRSPYGTKVPVGPQNWVYAYPMAEAANWITENNTDLGFESNYHDAISTVAGGMCWNAIRDLYATLPPVEFCLNDAPGALQAVASVLSDEVDGGNLDNICWNPKNPVFLTQVLSLATMSNTFPPELIAFISYINGVEIYPLLHNILHGSKPDDDILRISSRLIDQAPCEKFCWINEQDPNPLPYEEPQAVRSFPCDNTPEWKSTDRWMHPRRAEGDSGNDEINALHSGLDFLLLYNAFHLVRPQQIANGFHDTHSPPGEKGVLKIEGEFPRQVTTAFGCKGCRDRPAIFLHQDSIYFNAKIKVVTDSRGNAVPGAVIMFTEGNVEYGPDFEIEPGILLKTYIGEMNCDSAVFSYPFAVESNQNLDDPNALDSEDQLVIFPNPSGGLFHLETVGAPWEAIRIEVVDPAGRTLFTSENLKEYRIDIDLRKQTAGLYFVRVYWGERVYLRKLVLNR